MTTDYNKQATEFLTATNTILEVKEAEKQTPPQWEQGLNANHHIKYAVTLKNKNHSYTFDYWGSIADYDQVDRANEAKERGVYSEHYAMCERELKKKYNSLNLKQMVEDMHKHVMPSEYDILACLSPMYEDTFEDFCASFGYDTDSRTAEDTYKRCIEQDRQLHKLFTHEELDQLAEIN